MEEKCGVQVAIPAQWKPAHQQQVSTNEMAPCNSTLQGCVILAMVVVVAVLVPVVFPIPAVIVFEPATISVPVTRIILLSIVMRFHPSSAFIGRPRPVAIVPSVVVADRIPIAAYP